MPIPFLKLKIKIIPELEPVKISTSNRKHRPRSPWGWSFLNSQKILPSQKNGAKIISLMVKWGNANPTTNQIPPF